MSLYGRWLLILFSAAGSALAIEADIHTPLLYNIAYDLKPIQISVNVKAGNAEAATYHLYDLYKNDLLKGKLGMTKTISFTPPKYGWYLFMLEEGGKGPGVFIGVTKEFPKTHVLKQGEFHGGWNDEALQAFSGLMLDRTNTRMGLDRGLQTQAAADNYGVTLLMQFEGKGDCGADKVREAVTKFKGRVKYYEIVNEPNFGMDPNSYSELVKSVVPVIKSIDPNAKVMGIDTCGIMFGWYQHLYKTGAAKLLDALSMHDYDGHVDYFVYKYKMEEMRKLMAANGDEKKELWQTERAMGAVFAEVFSGANQAKEMTMQRDILQAFGGVENDHNNHYYASVTGYNQIPTFVHSPSGPHPAELATRTRFALTNALGRKFVKTLDFGPTGSKILLGMQYEGSDGTTVMLRNLGTLDTAVELGVTGGTSLEVVDSFGNVENVPMQDGKAKVVAKILPSYLMLAKGQQVKPPKIDFGPNIAKEAAFTYSAKVNKGNKDTLNNGFFEMEDTIDYPWRGTWHGSYTGKEFNEAPQTLDVAFGTRREIGGFIVYGVEAFTLHSPLLDYDLLYDDGGKWVTLEEVRAPCPQSSTVNTYMCHTMTWYQGHTFYVHKFPKPITTEKLRMVVRRIGRGCWIDMVVEKMRWRASDETLELREIEVYGPSAFTGYIGTVNSSAHVVGKLAP